MASRYGAFARSARSAFNANRTSSSSSSFRAQNLNGTRNQIPSPRKSKSFQNDRAFFRKRMETTRLPFHDVVASAKLVSRLAFNSRSCNSFSLCNFLCPHFPFFLCLPPSVNRDAIPKTLTPN